LLFAIIVCALHDTDDDCCALHDTDDDVYALHDTDDDVYALHDTDDAQSAARPHRPLLPSSSSSVLLLVDGQGKVVFVDPRRKLFEVISLGPVHRIVQLNSCDDAVASRHTSRHRHHSSHDHNNCNSHTSGKEGPHKEHGGDEGEHPNYIPSLSSSSSSSSSVIRRMDNVFLFLSIHNHTCDSHQQLVTIFRKTQLLQDYRVHSEDSMDVQHSQLWIPMELLRPSDMIAKADNEERVASSPLIQPDHMEERSVTMASLSIRLPHLESNAMLIHIDVLSSMYLHPNADFQLPSSSFSTGSNRYFLSNRQPIQTSIFEAILHALIRLSKKSSTSAMPTAEITESAGDRYALAAAARLSIAICTSDGGYSCWRDDGNDSDSGTLYSCTKDTSLMMRVLREVLQQNLLCSRRGRRSYSASFLSHLELTTKRMIESSLSSQQRSTNAPRYSHHHHLGIPSDYNEGIQRYVDFTRHLSSLDPLLLCELVSRLGRKLEPSTSKLLFPINIGSVNYDVAL